MMNKNDLFGDKYCATILYEYDKEMQLIRRIIELTEMAVLKKETTNVWSHEGICYTFAKSIADYLKMSYDNLVLGHFNAAHMIFRSIIENIVCLDITLQHEEYELWKYYLVQSYRSSLKSMGSQIENDELKFFDDLYKSHKIEEEFYVKSKKKKDQKAFAYIDRKYGWTYKINSDFTFSGICKLIDQNEYDEFKMMSMYSHGTDVILKVGKLISVDHIMQIVSFYYYSINRFISLFCSQTVDFEFEILMDRLGDSIESYLDELEDNNLK